MSRLRRAAAAALMLSFLVLPVLRGTGEDAGGARVTWKQVERYIETLKRALLAMQEPDGSLSYPFLPFYRPGMTALAGYALLEAGVPPDDPAIRAMETYCRMSLPDRYSVYSASFCVLFLAKADVQRNRDVLERIAAYLVREQHSNGMWSYSAQGRDRRGISESGDNSNTQFAVLALKVLHDAGIEAPRRVWERVRKHYERTQNSDGGWGYADWHRQSSYCAMTAAAVASLWIIREVLEGKKKHCTEVKRDPVFEAGVRYLDEHFSPERSLISQWHTYFLYAMERAGMITARRYFGGYDWYRAGAAELVRRQSVSDPAAAAFALLFLAKGKTPLLVQKLERPGGDWDNDHYDLENLTRFYSAATGRKVTWQLARVRGDASDLLEAPVLLISGRLALDLTLMERAALKEYLLNGGSILALPASDSAEFDRSFRRLMAEMFPDSPLMPLPKDHVIYRYHFKIPEADRPPIYTISQGCTMNILYVPRGRYTCRWTTEDHSGHAFEMGVNMLMFLAGDQKLKNRVDPVKFVPLAEMKERRNVRPPRGAVVIGQIKHSGQWRPLKHDITNLMRKLRDDAGVTVGLYPEPVDAEKDDLYAYPILYITGLYDFRLSDEACKRIREFVERGGFLFGDPACGRKEFDKGFRKFIARVFPGRKLEKIPLDHSIYTIGYDVRKVDFRPTVRSSLPDLSEPELEGVKVGDRYGVVYSRFNFSCGLDGMPAPVCWGYAPEDSVKIAVNIILYALNN